MEDKKIKELAQTLRNSGLAASDYEAVEKAKAILGTDIQRKEEKKEPMVDMPEPAKAEMPEKIIGEAAPEHEKGGFFSHLKEKLHHEKPIPEKHHFSEPDYDVSKEELTVNDLMREVGVNPEDINPEKEKIEDAEEKISELREEIFEEEKKPEEEKVEEIKHKIEELKEEVHEIEEEKEGEKQREKKVDLSRVFDSSEKQ